MPPIARGQAWLCLPLPVSTVPKTGRNISNSNYRGLDEKVGYNKRRLSVLDDDGDKWALLQDTTGAYLAV